MRHRILYKREAVRDLERLSPDVARRMVLKVQRLENPLAGNVKRLTSFSPEYRQRGGDWRGLFDVAGDAVLVHHVSHRARAHE